MQQAEAAEAEESSDDEAVQVPRASARARPRVKEEERVPATQQTIVEDLGDPSDDDEDEAPPPTASMVEDLGDPSESE